MVVCVFKGAWAAIDKVIAERDPYCRGVILLGLDAPIADLEAAFGAAKTARSVKGFAVGRTIFGDVARSWLDNKLEDDEAVAEMAKRFKALVEIWERP